MKHKPQKTSGRRRPRARAAHAANGTSSFASRAALEAVLKDARGIAFAALTDIEVRPVFLREALEKYCGTSDVSRSTRALATEIAAGVTRRRLTLDALIDRHVRRPSEHVESGLRTLLRIGTYQLAFLAVAPHAAIYQTVELARLLGKPRWTRFANGVLRSVQRDLTDELLPAPREDALPLCRLTEFPSAERPQPDAIPADSADSDLDFQRSGLIVEYRRLNSACFPSPVLDFTGYVSRAFSLPEWLVRRWESRYRATETLRLAAWFTTPGRVSLRVNLLKTARDELLRALEQQNIAAVPGAHPAAIRLRESPQLNQWPGFAEGLFSVQDESAMAATELLAPEPGDRVLDLCAAPGGKTAAIAERMRDQGTIIAADIDPRRVELIARGAARLGLTTIQPLVVRPDAADVPKGPFNRIMLDVPCSNTGVLGKRPEARWRISETGIAQLVQLQAMLLNAAADRLNTGGALVYSTCSIEPDENEHLVRSVVAGRTDLRLIREQHHRPGLPGDGAYQALLTRQP